MKKTLISIALLTNIVLSADTNSIKLNLEKKLPNTPIAKVVASEEMRGLYEIHSGKNIFFTNDEAESFIVGHIFSFDGKDLTQIKIDKLNEATANQQYEQIDLSKALKIGNGKDVVVEFTDPDCPWCRKAETMLKNKDITKYVFFFPLDMHPKAKAKAVHILCSKNQSDAYQNVLDGKMDSDKAKLLDCKEGNDALKKMLGVASSVGVQGTPLIFVNKTRFNGASPEIEKMLKEKK